MRAEVDYVNKCGKDFAIITIYDDEEVRSIETFRVCGDSVAFWSRYSR